MSKELDSVLESQYDLFGRISRAEENLKKMGNANITLSSIETRTKLLDQHWERFDRQHDQVRAGYKDKFKDSDYAKANIYETAENTYVLQRGKLDEYKRKFTAALIAPTVPREAGDDAAPKTALPRIKLPPFSGAFEDWPTFRDLFLSVIGNNKATSNIERFHYLRSCLQGPAKKLISPLAVTGENYARAWALLTKHFENQRELIRSNFTTFTAVPKMKADTADELNRIYNAVTTAVNAQESIKRPIESHGMDLFNHLIVELFDPRTRLEWESYICDSTDPPAHETLLDFICKRMLALNAARPKTSSKITGDSSRTAKTHFTRPGFDALRCALCKGKHTLMHCAEFKAKNSNERKLFVETSRLCYNCLGNHFVSKCQSTKSCLTCKSRHHTTLHDAYTASKSDEATVLSAVHHAGVHRAVLLATARVLIADRFGDLHTVRVLIDQGSEVSIISEALAQRLRVRRSRSAVSIVGVGGALSGSSRGKVTFELSSKVTSAKLSVVAYVLPRLSAYQGPAPTDVTDWTHLQGLPLADPQYLANDPVELLLGAEVFSAIFEEGLRKAGPTAPLAQKTSLGWILSGGQEPTTLPGHRSSLQCSVDDELVDLVRRFWEQEKETSHSVPLTPDEEKCEELFTRTHRRIHTGRYIVRLPLASTPPSFACTRKSAERLLLAMERKSQQDARFGSLYRAFMKEYDDLQHMELVHSSSSTHQSVCYLPHHGVLRESNVSTKLRVVFNGSQRTPSDDSLNTYLLTGASLLPSLADVLLRWRLHRFVLVADIEKMYRQIVIHPDDRDYQRILWRHTTTEEVHEYRLTTVTYGLSCAPFLAIRTLRQLASDEGTQYPKGAAALQRDCYVDDIVTGASTLEEASALTSELHNLCMAGGFPLRKWAANAEELLTGIPPEHRQQQSLAWENDIHSTLGLNWHPADDCFTFTIHSLAIPEFTKRRVLAETARLFDPLGWLSPVIARAKILIQSTWLQQLEWDTPLPPGDVQSWKRFLGELSQLKHLRIPRWLGCGVHETHVQLHGFADASERGYAAVIYLRTTTRDMVNATLLTAKTKVAPVKRVSLPRLELCAATLLTNLVDHARSVLNLITAPLFLWLDSQITLHWIHGHASRWKTYVANRVAHIQQKLPQAKWRHVPGQDNPADCASRGIDPSELINHPLWWTGPSWLQEDESLWPDGTYDSSDCELLEQRITRSNNTHLIETEPEMLLRFSSLHRLLRVTAWCLLWRRFLNKDQSSGNTLLTLLPADLDNALFKWARIVQNLHYPAEVAAVTNNLSIPNKSQLVKLSPILDNNNVLRVGGRLKHAVLAFDQRHPMILPPTSWLTKLVIESCHRQTLHGGVQLTLGLLRLRFWVPRGRALVKKTLHRCVVCTRWRAISPQPKMSDLPRGRVTPARPFLRTGVDYAGPIFIRTAKGRGHRAHKAFIAVFVCFCTKAVHLEVASDYTSEAFLAALRRFISRRGICEEIYSDCGTNFVGADKALRELFVASSPGGRHITQVAATTGIRWIFNPPAAPHFGGLWESAVKSMKHHLRRVIGETTLTFEEMSTFLAQVEACLNSRPLRSLSDDPDDLSALTPGHFLIGAPLLAIPEPSLTTTPTSSLSRWKLLQQMRDHFWERWSREYIHELSPRPKWTANNSAPDIGALCLIRSETCPPSRWPLARIVKLHPGKDGVVRVVTIRTSSSELTRPLTKIILLPGPEDASPPRDT